MWRDELNTYKTILIVVISIHIIIGSYTAMVPGLGPCAGRCAAAAVAAAGNVVAVGRLAPGCFR